MGDSFALGKCACFGLVLISVASILIVILIPLSFSDNEYFEMGFLQKKSTGEVDRETVYLSGRHFIGVDATFKRFRSDAHIENFEKMTFFNREKLQVAMTYTLQYFLIPGELKYLHDAYGLNYRSVLRETASSAIKNAASGFTIDEYRMKRDMVKAALFEAARKALGGTCCLKNCDGRFKCYPGCKPYSTCSIKDKGLFVFVKYFQLQEVDITEEQEMKFLRRVIEQEKQDTEEYKQRDKIERKKTEQEKISIDNAANELFQSAIAKSGLLIAQADASFKATLESARNSGLQLMHSSLNITSEEHMKSLDYIRTLGNHKQAMLYIGFKTLIAREMNTV